VLWLLELLIRRGRNV